MAVAVVPDLLLGHGQGGAAASPLEQDALLTHLLEQHEALLGAAVVHGRLHLLVVVTVNAADHGSVDLDRGALTVGGEPHVPDERGAHLAG